jgi:YhcH/YjgK/YiaL family protein
MILTPLQQLPNFYALHPRFQEAYEFLLAVKSNGIPEGRFEIDKDHFIAIVSSLEGNKEGTAPLEAHKKYIDIQYIISGIDHMGWKSFDDCAKNSKPYSEEDDKSLYEDVPSTYFDVLQNQCAIFFPCDAHAPMNGPGLVHKVILKIRL